MKRQLTTLLLVPLCMAVSAQKVTEEPGGVRVDAAGAETATQVTFYTDGAVRVTKFPKTLDAQPEHKSYSIIARPDAKLSLTTTSTAGAATVKSPRVTVSVDRQSGNVTFTTADGRQLLAEKTSSLQLITEGVDRGQYRAAQTWTLEKDEAIIGLGQRNTTAMNQRGQHVRIWSGNTNITIPYFASVKGYGLYWDNAGESRFDDSPEGTTFASEVARLEDYYFMYADGTQDGVIASIRDLTGQATMFPLWTMGYWQCRERYKTSDELCEVLDRYRELEVPLDGIVQDWQYWGCDSNWNAMDFMNPYYSNRVGDPQWAKYLPDDLRPLAEKYVSEGRQPRIKSPQEMVNYVHSHNAHLMISIWASFGPWTAQAAELKKIGALLPFETWPLNHGVHPYDPFNPAARDIYWKHLKKMYNMGIDAWWTDSTEPDHTERPGDSDYMTHDGSWRSVKNAFPLVTNRGIYEHQRAMKGNSKRSFQMTRCGAFGIQHYGTFSWSGDIRSDWATMRAQVPTGLNYVACGIPYWNTDIGGFFAWDYNNDPHNIAMQELQVRWMQYGCFMPLMRNHCSGPMVSEIYLYGHEGEWAYDVQKKFIRLRYSLLPYIYSNCGDVVLHSGTMMRPLMFDFPADKRAVERNDEYLFGRNLLVRPVTQPLYTWKGEGNKGHAIYPDITRAAAPVEVYLPQGTAWYDFWTGERHTGGRTLQRPAPIDIMPVYVRAGTILPWGPDVQYATQKPWDDLEIRVYAGADGDFTLYEDEGDNYNYERGAYTTIPFHYDDTTRTLTIGNREGKYKGMLQNRRFRVRFIGLTDTSTANVSYAGTKVTLTCH